MVKFIESGNIKIYLKEDVVHSSKMAILLIHGLAEHSGRYSEFVESLNSEGISVFSIDLRGHGQTTGKKGDCRNINSFIEDTRNIIEYIKSNYQFEKLGIFGHSVGGLITALYSSLNSDKIDFIVFSSPAIYCPKKLKILRLIPYKLLSFIYVKKKHSESKEMLELSKNDKFALHKFSIRLVGVLFVDGIKMLDRVLNINKPVLLVYGKQDRLLDEQSKFESFFEKLTNEKNKIIAYENAKHRIVQNEGSDLRIKDIIKWLKSL